MLTDRIAVVTGAAQGIGEATALALASLGAHVAVCDRQADGLAETVAAIEATGRRVLHDVFDVRDADSVESFMARVAAELGPIDILVNNVGGGFHAEFGRRVTKGEAALIAENFGTVTNSVRSALDRLADGAAIVNVTSVEAYHAAPGFGIYAAEGRSRAVHEDAGPRTGGRGIRVNCVAPDMIPTPGDAGLAADSSAMSTEHHPTPLRRMGSTDECAAVPSWRRIWRRS